MDGKGIQNDVDENKASDQGEKESSPPEQIHIDIGDEGG
jgi:hypothetical protein